MNYYQPITNNIITVRVHFWIVSSPDITFDGFSEIQTCKFIVLILFDAIFCCLA